MLQEAEHRGKSVQDTRHAQKEAKKHPGARYVNEDVILKVNPPASGAPADAMWIRDEAHR